MFELLTAFSAISFFCYGFGCLFSRRMVDEFERYGLARFRKLTGVLQLLGASGLALGLFGYTTIGFLAAAGLSLQMLLGWIVRLRIRDSIVQCLPAICYMGLNALIAFSFVTR